MQNTIALFKDAQQNLKTTLKSLAYTQWSNQFSIQQLVEGSPPLPEEQIDRVLDEIRRLFRQETDDDARDKLEDIIGNLADMQRWNDEIRKDQATLTKVQTTRTPAHATRTIITPKPSAPPYTDIYPHLHTKPTQVFVPPTTIAEPEKKSDSRFSLTLLIDSNDKKNASEHLLHEVTVLHNLVMSHRERIPNLISTSRRQQSDNPLVFDWLLGSIYVPTQYDQVEFTKIRNWLNPRIDEMFGGVHSFQNEDQLNALNEVLAQTHIVMAAYYRLHRIFGHKTVQQEIAEAEAKAKKEEEAKAKSRSTWFFRSTEDQISFPANDK